MRLLRLWKVSQEMFYFFAADRNKIVWNVLGALRVELAGQMGLLDKSDYKFLWVTEFPQFEWSDEEGDS